MCRVAAGLLALAATLAAGPAVGQKAQEVHVVNLPKVQEVAGAVRLAEPAPAARLVRLAEAIVAPVAPEETTALVPGGVVRADGFVSAVLSLGGKMRADHFADGRVGALLLPEVEPVLEAFVEEGAALFPLRVEAAVTARRGAHFASDQPAVQLGFPRYRVYYYNTSDRPASVTLWVYLVN